MRKILGVIVLYLLISQNVYSESTNEKIQKADTCYDKVKTSWNKFEKTDYVVFKIISNCEYPLWMYSYSVFSKDKKEIKGIDFHKNAMLKPYGVESYELFVGDINQEAINFGYLSWSWSSDEYNEKKNSTKKKEKELKPKSLLKKLLGKN